MNEFHANVARLMDISRCVGINRGCPRNPTVGENKMSTARQRRPAALRPLCGETPGTSRGLAMDSPTTSNDERRGSAHDITAIPT